MKVQYGLVGIVMSGQFQFAPVTFFIFTLSVLVLVPPQIKGRCVQDGERSSRNTASGLRSITAGHFILSGLSSFVFQVAEKNNRLSILLQNPYLTRFF